MRGGRAGGEGHVSKFFFCLESILLLLLIYKSDSTGGPV